MWVIVSTIISGSHVQVRWCHRELQDRVQDEKSGEIDRGDDVPLYSGKRHSRVARGFGVARGMA
jgi:hypothetical protein